MTRTFSPGSTDRRRPTRRRSANFVAAMLWLAEQGLPPRFQCLEIGSSGGINLMLARYHYALGGVNVGPEPGAMRIAPEWQGAPPPARAIEIASTRGAMSPRSIWRTRRRRCGSRRSSGRK
jgi:hypothetical protein